MAAILQRTTPKAALFLSSVPLCNTDRLVQFLGGFSAACDDGIALAEFVPWHNGGAILHRAASVDPNVVVEADTVVHSGVVLGKLVVVGSGAMVRPSVSVRYNVVLSNCSVGHFCTIHNGACIGQDEEKRYWQRYIYLWINYAFYEELDAKDMERTRDVYRECLKLIPHKKFTFAKLWLMAAQFEIRQKNLKAARQILGNAIGMAPKGKIFKKYIKIELYLGNFDRCRTLYEKYIEWSPANCYAWRKYAELEKNLSETDCARSIYELAIAQPALDTPEVLWKDLLFFLLAYLFDLVDHLALFQVGKNDFDAAASDPYSTQSFDKAINRQA